MSEIFGAPRYRSNLCKRCGTPSDRHPTGICQRCRTAQAARTQSLVDRIIAKVQADPDSPVFESTPRPSAPDPPQK